MPAEPTNYAIFRVKKLKTNSEIAGAVSHAMRTRPTPNIVSGGMNRVLWGSPTPAPDIHAKIDAAQSRSNSVKCIEVLATASPDFFKDMKKGDFKKWVNASCNHLLKTFGKDNVVHLQLHLDESTPHITGFIVPNKDGRLNARHWLGGKEAMRELQTGYHDAVKHLGLERGVKGSKATHQQVQQFYGAIDAETPEWRDPTFLELASGGGSWVEEIKANYEQMQLAAASSKVERHKHKEQQATSKSVSERSERTKKNAEKSAEEARKSKETLDRLRALPLEQVALELGLEKDTDDNWKDAQKRLAISINGRKFFDHKQGTGGGGSIDLVKHSLGDDTSFNDAKAWLMSRFGGDAIIQERLIESRKEIRKVDHMIASGEAKVFRPPQPVEANWPTVERYLNKARGLSRKLLQAVHEAGKIYADRFSNAVFAGERQASLRGTDLAKPFKGMAVGSDKSEAWRCTVGPEHRKHEHLIIGESAIDALSYAQMHNLRGTVASTNGVSPHMPKNLKGGAWQQVIVCYDNDPSGKNVGEKLVTDIRSNGFPKVSLETPPIAKDWNAQMILQSEQNQQQKQQKMSPERQQEAPTEPKPPKM